MSKFFLVLLLILISCTNKNNPETEILSAVFESKLAIETYQKENQILCAKGKCLFITFWDFDGTILKGDCSEGLKENGNEVYKGLIELGVEKGFAKNYKGEDGLKKLNDEYSLLEKKDIREAYLFAPKIFAGNDVKTLKNFAKEYFHTVLHKYYFPSSIQILKKLKREGVQSYIISASADFFVKGSEGTLPVEVDSMNGIEMKIENGKTTTTEIPPVTFGDGKRKKIELIVEKLLKDNPGANVYILAGFGNSYRTDGPFLEYIQSQKFPVGQPISVMVNGGVAPMQYKGKFKEVSFDLK